MRPGAEGSPPSPALGAAHILVSGLWLSRRLRTPAGEIPGKAGK